MYIDNVVIQKPVSSDSVVSDKVDEESEEGLE